MNIHKYIRRLADIHMIACTVLIFILSSCISEFVPPKGMKDMAGLLVVEGVISEEGTRIMLSRTVKLSEKNISEYYLFEDVNNAVIHIIDENHTVIAVATQNYNWGPYVVKEKFSFVPGVKYALEIWTSDLKHYQSAFVSPVNTPEIDAVNYKVNDDKSIDMLVSTHDPEKKANYFLWSFDEVWEIRSKLFEPFKYDPNTKKFSIPQSLYGENRYYCWAYDYSKSLVLASSAKYTDAVIKNKKIHTIRPGTTRYSYLYSILVRQYGLDKEAYDYFDNLQRNLDEGGSLFAPQPSEIPGNIQCLSNPEEKVIGYIIASKATTYRMYIPMAQELNLSYLEDQYNCGDIGSPPKNDEQAFGNGLSLSGGEYVRAICVDCTQRGGTKNKPDYWPNDHR